MKLRPVYLIVLLSLLVLNGVLAWQMSQPLELETTLPDISKPFAEIEQSLLALEAQLAQIAAQTADMQVQAATPDRLKASSVPRRRKEEPVIDAQLVSYAQPVQAIAPVQLLQNAVTDAPLVEIFAEEVQPLTPSSEQYWQRVQEIADTHIRTAAEKTQFLKEGSAIIQKLEEAEAAYLVALESSEWIKTHIYDEDLDATLKYHNALETVTRQRSLVSQYRRDLDAMVEPYQDKKPLKLIQPGQFAQPDHETRFSNLTADRAVTITPDGQFLIRIHFFYRDLSAGIPSLTNVTDDYNLSAMQSVSQQFFYPQDFTAAIYELMRQMWRNKTIEWSRAVDETLLQSFLTVLQG